MWQIIFLGDPLPIFIVLFIDVVIVNCPWASQKKREGGGCIFASALSY